MLLGKIGKFDLRVAEMPRQLLDAIQALVESGDRLLAEAEANPAKVPALSQWAFEFRAIVRQIDPRGEQHSGSLSMVLDEASYFSTYDDRPGMQYNATRPPVTDEEKTVVFRQLLGVAMSLVRTGRATVVSENSGLQKNAVFHRRQLVLQESLVFVVMPFVESWSDYIWRREIKPIVEGIDGLSLVCRRADDLFGQDVMVDIYESIASARIVIAEITHKNANVFYELGMAHALGKDVILLSQGAEHIPFDLNRFRHCIYSNDGPGYDRLRAYLPGAIRSVLDAERETPSSG